MGHKSHLSTGDALTSGPTCVIHDNLSLSALFSVAILSLPPPLFFRYTGKKKWTDPCHSQPGAELRLEPSSLLPTYKAHSIKDTEISDCGPWVFTHTQGQYLRILSYIWYWITQEIQSKKKEGYRILLGIEDRESPVSLWSTSPQACDSIAILMATQ